MVWVLKNEKGFFDTENSKGSAQNMKPKVFFVNHLQIFEHINIPTYSDPFY